MESNKHYWEYNTKTNTPSITPLLSRLSSQYGGSLLLNKESRNVKSLKQQ